MARTRRPARVFVAACGRSGRRGIAKAGPQWHRPGAEPGYALRSGTVAFEVRLLTGHSNMQASCLPSCLGLSPCVEYLSASCKDLADLRSAIGVGVAPTRLRSTHVVAPHHSMRRQSAVCGLRGLRPLQQHRQAARTTHLHPISVSL